MSHEKVTGGLADGKTVKDIAKKHQAPVELITMMLSWGLEVEKEHTKDINTAREIALDHLMEDPLYYKKLKEAGL